MHKPLLTEVLSGVFCELVAALLRLLQRRIECTIKIFSTSMVYRQRGILLCECYMIPITRHYMYGKKTSSLNHTTLTWDSFLDCSVANTNTLQVVTFSGFM